MRNTISQVAEYLFVYGTLRSEFTNSYAEKLRAGARLIGRTVVRGSIYRVADYPGYRTVPDGEVHGELYELDHPEQLLASLDRYEGSEYRRLSIPLDSGKQAWVYEYASEPSANARIASGDFLNQ